MKIEKVDRNIHSKKISKTEDSITISVTLVPPTSNNGIRKTSYNVRQAKLWLEAAGHRVGKCIAGSRVYNYDPKNSGAYCSGEWTFLLIKEEEKPKKAPAKKRTRAKATPVKETSIRGEAAEEFAGLNFDGVVEKPKPKTTTRRKRKSTSKKA